MKIERLVASIILGLGVVVSLALLLSLGSEPSVASGMDADGYAAYYVAPGGDCGSGAVPCYDNIQAAIDAVDDPRDVVKIATGVYTDVQERHAPAEYDGPNTVRQIVIISKTVAIQGGYAVGSWDQPDYGANPTTLDAQGRGRVFLVMGHITSTIEGLRLTGGDAQGLGGWTLLPWGGNVDAGGGIYIVSATVVLKDGYVLGNTAQYGGGLYLRKGDATLEGNIVSANSATSHGGGLYLDASSATLSENTISTNAAGHSGGGLYLWESDAALQGNVISFNAAKYDGGGVHLGASTVTLRGNTISLNIAENDGGGLYLWESDAALNGDAIMVNTASFRGGGLSLYSSSDVTMVNNLVTDNRAHQWGSGLYVQESTSRLVHTTIARNVGGDGSGLHVTGFAYMSEIFYSNVALTNTILAGHAVGITATAGSTVTLEATLWGDGAWANTTDWEGAGSIITGAHSYWGDPGFVCTSSTCVAPYRIGPDSAALDAGVSAGAAVDIDGELRPEGTGYDIGADEFYPSSSPPVPIEERLVMAFYHPWYSLGTWSRPEMLDTPLFPYSNHDPVAVARHVSWAQAAGLDGFIVSWAGWEDVFVDVSFARLLDALDGTNLRATIYIETLSQFFDSPSQIVEEIEYALDTYSDHPNFLRRDGRPMIFAYAVDRVAMGTAAMPYEAWQMILDELHADGYDPFLVADTIADVFDPAYLSMFDGLYTYLALRDVSAYQTMSCQARQAGKLWAADIFPGFDDRLLYWRDPYHLYIPRDGGQTYLNTFAAALQTDPDWLLVTSFSEWYENTHIEPSVMYGYDYLLRTADLATQFHAWHALPTVHVDAAYTGPEDGSAVRPYNTLEEALMVASDGATLRVAGGVYSGPITVTRSITLVGGYDPTDWTRNQAVNPTILRGDGSDTVLRIRPYPCSFSPSVVLDGLTITGGDATGAPASGGGVRVEDAALRLVGATIMGNRAQDHGGGIFVEGNSQLMIQDSHILSNTANVGGGLFVDNGARLWLTNSVLARNKAMVAGGGLYVRPDASVSVVNSTLTDNDAPTSGKGAYAWSLSARNVTITNSIVWGNGDDTGYSESSVNDLRCLKNCSVGYSDIAGGWTGLGNLDADPLFFDPYVGDYHLRPDSPVIDAGDPAGVRPVGPAPALDIDGDPRPLGGGVDLGVDEVGPLARSSITVDKDVILLGQILNYTITLTSTEPSDSLPFWVTDTLSLFTNYVSGSLRVSAGTAVYVPADGTAPPPADGTILLPHILWTGTVTPGQSVYLSFAVTVHSQTALYCADIVNVALIRTDVDGPGGRLSVERSVITRISDGVLHEIVIQDAAGASGTGVGTRTLQTGEALVVYAAGYDGCGEYSGPVSVTWETSGTLEHREHIGTSFTFTPSIPWGEGTIIADDGQGHTDETGLITVVYASPQISISPPFLFSTQPPNQSVTQALTISNRAGMLTYKIASIHTRPFELTYEWDDSFFIDADTSSGNTLWDYYATPEQVASRLAGAEVKVAEIEIQSGGINLANWINWDWEVHMSDQGIGLPGGQTRASRTSPWSGYDRSAPCQLLFTVGEVRDPSSYVYHASHNFDTGAMSVIPFYGHTKDSHCASMQLTDGLHAQVFFWTGDPRVAIQFDRVRLTVRGVVTYTTAGWVTVDPISGTLGPGDSHVIDVGFDSANKVAGVYYTAIIVRSDDPDDAVSIIPASLTVIVTPNSYIYVPLLMRDVGTP